MAERDDDGDQDRLGEPTESQPSQRNTEDVVFPESFRKFWRTLLGAWGRR
ncbi:hypothetical protein [Mycolicibacterium helvum]|uniref:Uncharacterized protein n=1 Tax=Mycolicibacterium helvum TaxID=1534349 RepID=A0A7I7SZL9_9MYCO|nr:hypothetical protein [Mycolicibacterium helvum]BBY62477.1 hypothetical protein MHEL_07200 [Mycolicibacterium helvum]